MLGLYDRLILALGLVLALVLPAAAQLREFPIFDEQHDPAMRFTLKPSAVRPPTRVEGHILVVIAPVAQLKRFMPDWSARIPESGTAFVIVEGDVVQRVTTVPFTSGSIGPEHLGLPVDQDAALIDIYWIDNRMEIKPR